MRFLVSCKQSDEINNPDDEEDNVEEKGFWETEEGKKKLDEIAQMQQLVAEAEKLQKAAEDGKLGQTKEDTAAKMQQQLTQRAKEVAQRMKQAEMMFQMGQRAYGKGAYNKAVEFLEAALTNVSKGSNLGGDIQIWLAMSYEAHNRHEDCISLYKRLESSHPSQLIRRQAAELRYITEAPKLKISSEERVTIPIIDAYSRSSQKTWSQMAQEVKKKRTNIGGSSTKLPKKAEDWIPWNPPKWEKNPYFWVAVTLWLTLAGVALMFQD